MTKNRTLIPEINHTWSLDMPAESGWYWVITVYSNTPIVVHIGPRGPGDGFYDNGYNLWGPKIELPEIPNEILSLHISNRAKHARDQLLWLTEQMPNEKRKAEIKSELRNNDDITGGI